MEAQINQTSLQNAAQREKVALFNHFYEKLAFFLIRVVITFSTDVCQLITYYFISLNTLLKNSLKINCSSFFCPVGYKPECTSVLIDFFKLGWPLVSRTICLKIYSWSWLISNEPYCVWMNNLVCVCVKRFVWVLVSMCLYSN